MRPEQDSDFMTNFMLCYSLAPVVLCYSLAPVVLCYSLAPDPLRGSGAQD